MKRGASKSDIAWWNMFHISVISGTQCISTSWKAKSQHPEAQWMNTQTMAMRPDYLKGTPYHDVSLVIHGRYAESRHPIALARVAKDAATLTNLARQGNREAMWRLHSEFSDGTFVHELIALRHPHVMHDVAGNTKFPLPMRIFCAILGRIVAKTCEDISMAEFNACIHDGALLFKLGKYLVAERMVTSHYPIFCRAVDFYKRIREERPVRCMAALFSCKCIYFSRDIVSVIVKKMNASF